MGQHFHIHLYDAPTTQAEKIARVRALYERPGTPGEKAAAKAALERMGVKVEEEPKARAQEQPKATASSGGSRNKWKVNATTKEPPARMPRGFKRWGRTSVSFTVVGNSEAEARTNFILLMGIKEPSIPGDAWIIESVRKL